MDKENKEAWEMLLESLDAQQKHSVKLQEREIILLKQVMALEAKNRSLVKAFSEEKFKKEEPESEDHNQK